MSAVYGAGSAQQSSMLQYLQQQQGGSFQLPNLQSAGIQKPSEAQIQSAAESLGIDPSEFTALRGELESAVQGALEDFDGSGDPREAISSAVNSVLDANGIDADAFKAQMEDLKSAAGFQPPQGGFGNFGGIQTSGYDSAQQQSDLISQLFGNEEDDKNTSSGSFNIADYFSSLPAGSLVNTSA